MASKNKPGCNCCCGSMPIGCDVGFNGIGDDLTSFLGPVKTCCPKAYELITDLMTDVSRIYECRAVFTATFGCIHGAQVKFAEADWPTVRDYVEQGGRLYVGHEYVGNGTSGFCTTLDYTAINNAFLTAIGSSMQFMGNVYCDSGALCGTSYGEKQGDYKILRDTPGLLHAATGGVTGGTSLLKVIINDDLAWCDGVEPYTYVAIEQLGQGYVVCVPDCNPILGACGEASAIWHEQNCKFFKNFIELPELI